MSVPHRHYDSGVTEERLYEMQWHAPNREMRRERVSERVPTEVSQSSSPTDVAQRRMSRLQSNGFLFVSTNT